MDMLPGMKRGLAVAESEKVEPIKKMVGPMAPKAYNGSPTSAPTAEMRMISIAIISFLIGILLATYWPRLVGDLGIPNGGLSMPHLRGQMWFTN